MTEAFTAYFSGLGVILGSLWDMEILGTTVGGVIVAFFVVNLFVGLVISRFLGSTAYDAVSSLQTDKNDVVGNAGRSAQRDAAIHYDTGIVTDSNGNVIKGGD